MSRVADGPFAFIIRYCPASQSHEVSLHVQQVETDRCGRSNEDISALRSNNDSSVSISDGRDFGLCRRSVDDNVIELDIPRTVVYVDENRRRGSRRI